MPALVVPVMLFLFAAGCSKAPEPVSAPPPEQVRPAVVTIRVVSTNDIHGALAPTLASELSAAPGAPAGGRLGGVDYLAGMIGKIRAQAPERTVVVDAGDCSQGDYPVNASEGMFCTGFFNAVGYTVRTIGNHEFDYLDVGPDGEIVDPRGALRKAAAAAAQPIVLANAHLTDGSPIVDSFLEYRIVDVAGVKVGFTGVITPLTPTVSRRAGSSGVVFEQPVDALRRVLPRMRAAGATVVIVLSHLTGLCEGRADTFDPAGRDACALNGELSEIQKSFTQNDIDLIVSGHDHVLLRGDGPNIPVVENPGQGVSIGLVEIDVDPASGRRVGVARVLPHVPVCLAAAPGSRVCDRVWPGYMGVAEPDPAVAELRRATEAVVAAECADVVATAATDIMFYRGTEPPLANLAVDLLRELGAVPDGKGGVADAAFAFMNRGSSRGSLSAGPVTMCDIARVWPFNDAPVAISMTGAEIVRMMTFLIDDVKKAPVISGLRVSRTGKEPIVVTDAAGTPLAPDRMYRVITTNYLREGGDRMDEFFGLLPADRFEVLPYESYRDGFTRLMRARKIIVAPDTSRYTGVTRE